MKLTIVCGESSLVYEQEQERTKGSHLAFKDNWSGSCVTKDLITNIETLCNKVSEMETIRVKE